MMIHKKIHDDCRTWIPRPRTLAVAVAIAMAGGLAGCKSNTANPATPAATSFTAGTDTTAAKALPGYFQNGTTYYIKVDYSKVTGAAASDVAYKYHTLPGDNGSGVSATNVTTGYLAKVTATDPGPQFLLNGLLVRPSSSEANVAQRTGSGDQTVTLSSEVWLNDWLGGDGLQIQDLRSSPPFLITEHYSYPTAFYGWMSPSGKYYVQIIGEKVRFIDTSTRKIVKMLSLPGHATNIAFGTYAGKQYLYATYAGTTGYEVARVDLSTLSVVATGQTDSNAGGGSHKNYYYNGPVWTQAGGDVWGLNPGTLKPTARAVYPSVQGDRHGTVGSGLVSKKDLSAGVPGPTVPLSQSLQRLSSPDITRYLAQTTATPRQAATVPFCTLHQTFSATNSGMLRALSSTAAPFYNIGWGTVGVEPSPDGKLTMFGVRLGDFVLFLDTDPTSPNFGQPARFVYPNFGIVKDATNAVVGTFTTPYSGTGAATGLATGNLLKTDAGNYRWTRNPTNSAAGETYVEPCDSTMMLTPSRQVWSWEPDVDGDTLTGVNVSQIDGATPGKAVYEVAIPVVKSAAFFKGKHSAGPWMATLENDLIAFKNGKTTIGSPLLLSVQYEGENAEGTWNVTNPKNVYEIQRTYHNLANVIDPNDPNNPTVTTSSGSSSSSSSSGSSSSGALASPPNPCANAG